MTPADWGDYVIGALPYAGAEALRIALVITIPFTVLAAAIWAVRRGQLLGSLMDDGDGQGGVPRLPRPGRRIRAWLHRRRQLRGLRHLAAIAAEQEHRPAAAVTQAISMRDLIGGRAVTG